MTSRQVITEEQIQSSYWFTYWMVNIFVGLFVLVVGANDHGVFFFFGVCAMVLFNAWRVPMMTEVFKQRLKYIMFKNQIMNLYVYSENEDEPGDDVVATFKKTVNYLKEVGNVHEVRVHLILFGDVRRFTWWWDSEGVLQKTSKEREKFSATESWEQYMNFITVFESMDTDERLRKLRTDNDGFDWVNQYVFDQLETAE